MVIGLLHSLTQKEYAGVKGCACIHFCRNMITKCCTCQTFLFPNSQFSSLYFLWFERTQYGKFVLQKFRKKYAFKVSELNFWNFLPKRYRTGCWLFIRLLVCLSSFLVFCYFYFTWEGYYRYLTKFQIQFIWLKSQITWLIFTCHITCP